MKVAIKEAIRAEEEILGKIAQKVTEKVKKVADSNGREDKGDVPGISQPTRTPYIHQALAHAVFGQANR